MLLILVAFAAGRGARGVIIAVAVTHWPSLTRLLRGASRRVAASDYVAMAQRLGHGGWWVARRHLLAHLVPYFTVGLVLLFPHAILHEAALSFLGLGLSPHAPAIGIILSDRCLVAGGAARACAARGGQGRRHRVGENLRALADPRSVHE